MKCTTCDTIYEGSFCPKCGTPAQNGQYVSSYVTPKKAKKPIYQKWWFWLIIIIVGIGVIANMGGKKDANNTAAASPSPSHSVNNIAPTATPATPSNDTEPNTAQTSASPSPSPEPTKDLSSIETTYTLTSGNYAAGIDIPTGRCDVTAVTGTGNLSSSNMYNGGVNEMFGIDDGSGFYTSSFNGLKLPRDTVLSISGGLTIKLVYKSIDSDYTGRTYDDSSAINLKSGNYLAGTDFSEGIYKIVAVSGTGNLSSSNMYDGGLNEMFGVDDGSGFYTPSFTNAVLSKGVELQISGGLSVKLIPAN